MDGRARWRVSEGVSDSTLDLSSSVLRENGKPIPQIDAGARTDEAANAVHLEVLVTTLGDVFVDGIERLRKMTKGASA